MLICDVTETIKKGLVAQIPYKGMLISCSNVMKRDGKIYEISVFDRDNDLIFHNLDTVEIAILAIDHYLERGKVLDNL